MLVPSWRAVSTINTPARDYLHDKWCLLEPLIFCKGEYQWKSFNWLRAVCGQPARVIYEKKIIERVWHLQLTSVSSTVGVKHSPRLVFPGSVADTCLFSPPLLVIRTQTSLVWLADTFFLGSSIITTPVGGPCSQCFCTSAFQSNCHCHHCAFTSTWVGWM